MKTTGPRTGTTARSSSLLLVVLVLACLAAPTPAQGPCASTEFSGGNMVCLPAGLTGSYSDMVAGNLNGDWTPEVALLQGTNLIVAHNAATGNDSVVVASDALTVCYVADAAGAGQPGLFFTSSQGLYRVVWLTEESAYSAPEIVAGDPWKNAVELHYAQGALYGVDLLTRKKILRSYLVAGEVQPGQELFSLTTPTVRDMRLMDWDGGAPEIVLQHSNGLHVRGQDGSFVLARAAATPNDPYDAIAVAHLSGLGDVLAWVTPVDGDPSLLLFSNRYGSPFYRGPFVLSEGPFNAVTAGDISGDGDDDLVFSLDVDADVHVLYDLKLVEQQSPFLGLSSWTVEIGMSAPGCYAEGTPSGAVLCADLFNDRFAAGSVDRPLAAIARASMAAGALWLRPSPATSAPSGIVFSYQYGDIVEVTYCNTTNKWTIDVGDGWGSAAANYMEFVVRAADHANYPDPPVLVQDPVYYDLVSRLTSQTVLEFEPVETGPWSYFVQVRPVHQEPSTNTISQVWRSSIIGMSNTCEGYCWLKDLPGTDWTEEEIVTTGCNPLPGCGAGCTPGVPFASEGFRYIPAAVPQSRFPSTGPGVLPGDPPQ